MRSSSGECGFVIALCARGFESCPRSQVVYRRQKPIQCQNALSSHSQSCVCLPVRPWPTPCSDPGEPHAISGNFSVDLYGLVDTRPGTYGHADYVIWNQTFENVPAGCRVQILHIWGDLIAWPRGHHSGRRLRWRAGSREPILCWRIDTCGLGGRRGLVLLPVRDDGERDSDSD